MADQIIEVVGPGSTVEVVDEGAVQIIELDSGGQAGPRGPAGPVGPEGNQGPQGRFNLQIFRRDTVTPTEAPVGGSFNIDTGVLTAPDGWGTNPNIPGAGDLYQARSNIDPAVQSGIVTPLWSVPFEAGGTGPPGLPGDSVEVFYANDAQGSSASTVYNNQPFIAFVLYFSGTNPPMIPPAGTVWLRFLGPAGAPGEDVLIFYADDAAGTNATTTYNDQNFIAFVLFDTDTQPPTEPPPGTVFSRFVGATGAAGQAIITFYADSDTGANATTTYSNQDFVAFVQYLAGTTPPSVPPAGTVWLRFVGPSGLGIPYLTASNIPITPQQLVAGTEYHIRVSNLTNTDLPNATALQIDNLGIPAVELDIDRNVPSGDTAYFTWTPTQSTINSLINNFGSRTALDVILRFGTSPNNVDVTIVDDVADRLQTNTTYDLSAEDNTTANSTDIRLTGSDMTTDNVSLLGAGGLEVTRSGNVITLTGGGGPAPHAQLVPEFSIMPTSITLPILGTQTVTATATATIRDAASGDVVNSCLLYTSPSPRDSLASRMPSSA